MKFDPTKKFGTVHGQCNEYPGARYSQGGFVYDAHHKCLNPTEAKEAKEENLIVKATKDLLDKKKVELKEVTDAIVSAQEEVEATGTAGAKGKLTKLTKKYDALILEIESMGG